MTFIFLKWIISALNKTKTKRAFLIFASNLSSGLSTSVVLLNMQYVPLELGFLVIYKFFKE